MSRNAFDYISPHTMTKATRQRILRLAAATVATAPTTQFWVGDFHHAGTDDIHLSLRLVALTRVALGLEPLKRHPNPRWPKFPGQSLGVGVQP